MILFEDFVTEVKSKVQAFFGEKYTVSVADFKKNNGVVLHGLTALPKGSNISPTIYLEPFYEAYCKGALLQDIVLEIYRMYEQYKFDGEPNLDFLTDYEQVKPKVFHKIINYEDNRDFLEDVPYLRFLDLAIVCYIYYSNDFMGEGSILIKDGMLKEWQVEKETVFFDAYENTEKKQKRKLCSMHDVLLDLIERKIGEDEEEIELMKAAILDPDLKTAMYVLTFSGGNYGAVNLFHEGWMEAFSAECGGDFFILPSSIHELILIPNRGTHSATDLKHMVEEVNQVCVMDEEKLSDNVYFYDAKAGEVNICNS